MLQNMKGKINLIEDFVPFENFLFENWTNKKYKAKTESGKKYKVIIDGKSGDGQFHIFTDANVGQVLIFPYSQNGEIAGEFVAKKILNQLVST